MATKIQPPESRFWPKVKKSEGCWEWQACLSTSGYGYFFFRGRNCVAHRCIWEMRNGPIPAGLQICHACDNRKCVRPDHLWLGTQQDNITDMFNKGRENRPPENRARGLRNGHTTKPECTPRGEKHGRAKLTLRTLDEIFRRYKIGDSAAKLGEEFGVTRSTIFRALRGETWKQP